MNRVRASWLVAVPAIFMVVFLVVPVGRVLTAHLRPHEILDVLSDPSSLRIMWFSLWQAVVSTSITLVVALPATWALSRFTFAGDSLARGVLTAPFVMPAVVVAAGVLAVLPEGHNRGVAPILWAHVIFNVAVVVRVVSPRWILLDERLDDAAAVLGAGRLRTFSRVVWPQIADAVVNATTLVFIFCFTSFGVVSVLGGFDRRTIETEIFIQSVRLGDTRTATALALVQATIVTVVLVGVGRMRRRRGGHGDARQRRPLAEHAGNRAAIVGLVAGTVVIVAAPLVAIVVRSLRLRGRFTLVGWRALGNEALPGLADSALRVMGTSSIFAVSTAVICVPLAVLVATFGRRISGALSALPLVISAATLGIGVIVTFDRDPFAWRSTTWIIPVIHAVVAFPLVVRTLTPAQRAVPQRLRDAAAMLGAGPLQVWRHVDLRLMRPALARASGLSMAVSLGEFGATSFLSRSGSTTMPIAIARLLGRPGDVPTTAGFALSALMVIMTIGVMSRA